MKTLFYILVNKYILSFIAILTILRMLDLYITYIVLEIGQHEEINPLVNTSSYWAMVFSPVPLLLYIFGIMSVVFGILFQQRGGKIKTANEIVSFGFILCFVLMLAVINNSLIYFFDITIINTDLTGFVRDNLLPSILILIVLILIFEKLLKSISSRFINLVLESHPARSHK